MTAGELITNLVELINNGVIEWKDEVVICKDPQSEVPDYSEAELIHGAISFSSTGVILQPKVV